MIAKQVGALDGASDGAADGEGAIKRSALKLGCKLIDGTRVGTVDGDCDGSPSRLGPELSDGDALGLGDLLGMALGSSRMGIKISKYEHVHFDGVPGYAA